MHSFQQFYHYNYYCTNHFRPLKLSRRRMLVNYNGENNHVGWHIYACASSSNQAFSLSLVLLPAGRVNVPNITAYMVPLGDVKAVESRAEIVFHVPNTTHPIVIYGMKGRRPQILMYNSIDECPSLTVRFMAGNRVVHQVRKRSLLCSLCSWLGSDSLFSLQITHQRETMMKPQSLADILRSRVFVSGVTHVEVQLDFPHSENMGERPKTAVFETYFIAAGTFMTYNFTATMCLLSGIRLIVTNLSPH